MKENSPDFVEIQRLLLECITRIFSARQLSDKNTLFYTENALHEIQAHLEFALHEFREVHMKEWK